MKETLLNETLLLKEFLIKPKKDPKKSYVTDSDLRTLGKCGMDVFTKALARIKKETGKTISITLFKEDKNKVNKKVTTYAVGSVSGLTTEMKSIIRDEAKKYKTSNKLFGGFRIENFGSGVAILVKLKGEHYYWK